VNCGVPAEPNVVLPIFCAQDWRQIEADLPLGLPSGPLDTSSVLFQTLVPVDRRRSLTVQYVARLPVDAEPSVGLAERFDRLLKGLSSPTQPE
jgi:hypothetical protein